MKDYWPFIALFLVYALATQWELHNVIRRGREERDELIKLAIEERRSLENRLVALTDRDASSLVYAQEQASGYGDVHYVDERAELELQREE